MTQRSSFLDNARDPDTDPNEEPVGEEGMAKEELLRLGLPTRERDYLYPAKDAKGQSSRLQVRVMPEVARLVADLFQQHKYPFRVMGDLLRYCIVKEAKRLAAGAGLPSVIAQGDLLTQILIDHEYQHQFQHNFELTAKNIAWYMQRGAAHKARQLVTILRDGIKRMPEGYWRLEYEKKLMKDYGHLLDGDEGNGKQAGDSGTGSAFLGEEGDNGKD